MSDGQRTEPEAEKKNADLRKKWKLWVDKMGRDLGDLLISHDIFEEVRQIVASNKRIQSPPTYFYWIRLNYVDSLVVRLTRLNDHDRRTISLQNLIKEIVENPEAITRDYFVSRYDKWMQDAGIADHDFNDFSEPGEHFVSRSILEKDLDSLDDITKRIKIFRDKCVAHLDENRTIERAPTTLDAQDAMKALDRIFCKYYMLIDGGGMRTAKPSLQFDWKEPLRHPWIEMSCGKKQSRQEDDSVRS